MKSKAPFAIIGLALAAAIGFGFWFYSDPVKAPVKNTGDVGGKPTPSSNAFANKIAAAPAGASPAWTKGNPNATVVIEEFGDYQCPVCGVFHKTMKEIETAYGNRIKFTFRNFPLTMHPFAYDAARAAEAAGNQGKFWEMHNKIYESQQEWSAASDAKVNFLTYAKDLGLDLDKFATDMGAQNIVGRVSDDMRRGKAIDLNSTPTIIINGKRSLEFDDFKTTDRFRQVIDAELQKAAGTSPTADANSKTNVTNSNASPAGSSVTGENKNSNK